MTDNARKAALAAGTFAALLLPATAATSQSGAAVPAQAAAVGPAVGEAAPDFTLTGATRYGVLRSPVRLSDFRDQTVVLAFFAQARTKG